MYLCSTVGWSVIMGFPGTICKSNLLYKYFQTFLTLQGLLSNHIELCFLRPAGVFFSAVKNDYENSFENVSSIKIVNTGTCISKTNSKSSKVRPCQIIFWTIIPTRPYHIYQIKKIGGRGGGGISTLTCQHICKKPPLVFI